MLIVVGDGRGMCCEQGMKKKAQGRPQDMRCWMGVGSGHIR
jgi:hypothetical protein